jgi:AcrR family transcriptional regulator
MDGRLLRSVRTRQLIIDAYLALLRESPQAPTAAQIAKRAGCSTRSVFERFADLLTLSTAAADYIFTQAQALPFVRDPDADRLTRVKSHVETRAVICEQWLPMWRALVHNQNESEILRARIGFVYDMIGERLKLMFGPELSAVSAAEQKQLLIALESLTDFESWGRMRERHGLSVEAACAVWINVIDRMMPPTPKASAQG